MVGEQINEKYIINLLYYIHCTNIIGDRVLLSSELSTTGTINIIIIDYRSLTSNVRSGTMHKVTE